MTRTHLSLAILIVTTLSMGCSSSPELQPDPEQVAGEAGGAGGAASAGPAGGSTSSSGGTAPLGVGDAKLTFATGADVAAVLGQSDAWSQTTSAMERSLRLGTTDAVSEEALLTHAAAQGLDWPAAEETMWQEAFAQISEALDGLSVSLPDEVVMVRTTGLEEFGAYTRGPAIVIPAVHEVQDAFFLGAHELFHIVTRHDPAMHSALYAMLSFVEVPAVPYPASLEPLRVTNPDAFSLEHALSVDRGGSPTFVVPILQSKYDLETAVQLGQGYYGLEMLLLPVDSSNGTVTGAEFPPSETNFEELMARNTAYTIHPEEALADNFAWMLRRRLGMAVQLDDVALVDELEAYFTR